MVSALKWLLQPLAPGQGPRPKTPRLNEAMQLKGGDKLTTWEFHSKRLLIPFLVVNFLGKFPETCCFSLTKGKTWMCSR